MAAATSSQLQLCRHKCSHQTQQQQKQVQHHVKWKPTVPDRVSKPKVSIENDSKCPESYPYLPNSNDNMKFVPRNTSGNNLGQSQTSAHSVNPMVAKVSALPRKWCEFVFRRNNDNNLYKSESFRFIQKTSSLEPLLPRNAYIRNRLRRAAVPVNDDYQEPLDQLISSSEPHSQPSSQPSDSRFNTGFGTDLEEPSYHEITEKYNAPYYYSDTLKGSEPANTSVEDTSPKDVAESVKQDVDSPSITFILYNHHDSCPLSQSSPVNTNSSELREKSQFCHCFFPSEEAQISMARKRYETAFLPTTNGPRTRSSPDVDAMLLGIESDSFTLDNDTGEVQFMRNNGIDVGDEDSIPRSSRNASSKYNAVSGVTIIHCHPHSSSNSPVRSKSSLVYSASSKIIPLSEPLPQKKYISYLSTGSSSTQSTSSTGCSTTMSSSPSHSSSRPGSIRAPSSTGRLILDHHGHHGRGNMAILVKNNSVSSLESIDSLTSEDMKCGQSIPSCQQQQQRPGQQHLKTAKLLSPISDKSPIEQSTHATSAAAAIVQNLDSLNIQDHRNPFQISPAYGNDSKSKPNWTRQNLESAVELTNVPWEMPKLRRKLALLADSGISLDFPSSRLDIEEPSVASKEFKRCFQHKEKPSSFVQDELNRQASRPNFQNAHIRGHLELSLHKPSEFDSELSYHECEGDEYYESEESRYGLPSQPLHVESSVRKLRPDKGKMKLDFGCADDEIDPSIELEGQEWFHGAITRVEAETILRATKEGSFLVRNCESSTYCRYSLSIKSARGFIHIRIEPNSLGTFSLAEHEFPTVSHMVLHFMTHRLPIKGAEHVKLKYPVITQLL